MIQSLFENIPEQLSSEYVILAFLVAFVLSVILTRLSIIAAVRFGVMALPGHRSSHEHPTPRVGGIGLVIAFIALVLFLAPRIWNYGNMAEYVRVVMLGGILAFLLGLTDDVRTLRPVVKLVGQIIIAAIPIALGVYVREITLPFLGDVSLGVAGIPLTYIWIVFFTNAFNFMDGMDGKAGSFSIIALVGLAVVLLLNFNGVMVDIARVYYFIFAMILIAAVGGFLMFNYPPASVFMGDCGSQFLGYMLAVNAVFFPKMFAGFFLALLPFTFDVVYTLIRRWRRGENLLKAHRSHLYQRLLIIGYSHRYVLHICLVTYIICTSSFITYTLTPHPWVKIGAVLLALLTMVAYSIYVIRKEYTRGVAHPG